MSDFTKDELNTLQDCVWHILHCDKMHISCEAEKELDIIMNKISTMIDNYCDTHDWEDDGSLMACCKKCGKLDRYFDVAL